MTVPVRRSIVDWLWSEVHSEQSLIKAAQLKSIVRIAALLSALASGCAIHHSLRTQDVILRGAGNLPLSLGVVEDPSWAFDYPDPSSRLFVEDLNPGFANTLQGAFSYPFRHVSAVRPGEAVSGVDIIALSTLEFSDPMRLTVTFVDPKSRTVIGVVSAMRPLDANAEGAYSHIGTDLMLFAIVVVVPPLDPFLARSIKRHDAERFNAVFEPAFAQMVGEIALRASRDPALRAFAGVH